MIKKSPPARKRYSQCVISMRTELLLRIGEAQQVIHRRVEALENRAYDADKKTARQLKQQIKLAEASYQKLEQKALFLTQDSLLGDWFLLKHETELLIIEAGRILGASF